MIYNNLLFEKRLKRYTILTRHIENDIQKLIDYTSISLKNHEYILIYYQN